MVNTSALISAIMALLLMIANKGTDASHLQSLAIGSAAYHTCVVLGGGSLNCWGYNSFGQLGQGSTVSWGSDPSLLPGGMPVINLGTGVTAVKVSAGDGHTCAITNGGGVKCWGLNTSGQLGLGSSTGSVGTQPTDMGDALQYAKYLSAGAASVALGQSFTCVLQSTGTVRCWGLNAVGQLGRGDTTNVGLLPSDVVTDVPLGTGRIAKSISVGAQHVCAILDNDLLKCWGANSWGQLGLDSTNDRGNQPGEMGDNLPYVNLGSGRTAKQVSCGVAHTCAVLDDNTLKCWGINFGGQLGLSDGISSRQFYGTSVGDMAALGPIDVGTGRTVKAMSVGLYYTCAILDNDQLKCWGQNGAGQLGIGSTSTIGDNPGEMGDNLATTNLGTGRVAVSVGAYVFHTCALLDNGDLKCWGSNGYGQLGLGITGILGDALSEMGDNLPAVDFPLAHRPPPPSPPPPPGKRYECRSTKQYLIGAKQIGSFKAVVPGITKPTDAERAAFCRDSCDGNGLCDGYVYKADRTCILKSGVSGFTTQTWDDIYIACQVVA